MNPKETIKKLLSEKNPLAVSRREKMRSQLKNTTPTFLCPNCLGGILFHDLGLKFQSPTVNLMMFQTDFVKLVLNLDEYLEQEFTFYDDPDYICPCAYLGDITVHFTHYKTAEEAVSKWKERAERIDRDNMFIFAMERDGLSREDIQALGTLPVRGIVVFTANEYRDIPYALYLPELVENGQIEKNVLSKSYLDDSRIYEKYFDFVKWFNEADGGDFDVRAFVK